MDGKVSSPAGEMVSLLLKLKPKVFLCADSSSGQVEQIFYDSFPFCHLLNKLHN